MKRRKDTKWNRWNVHYGEQDSSRECPESDVVDDLQKRSVIF